MRFIRTLLPALLLALSLSFAHAPGVQAMDKLDQYRASGVIAERYDGYVEMRGGGPADAAKLVNDVNRQRKAIYEKRARQQNVPVSAVGALFAKKIIGQAPSGTYFRSESGGYRQK